MLKKLQEIFKGLAEVDKKEDFYVVRNDYGEYELKGITEKNYLAKSPQAIRNLFRPNKDESMGEYLERVFDGYAEVTLKGNLIKVEKTRGDKKRYFAFDYFGELQGNDSGDAIADGFQAFSVDIAEGRL